MVETRMIFSTVGRIFLTLGLILNPVFGYPDGASENSCGHLTPGHGIAQLSPSPYAIEISTDTYRPRAIVSVTITGPPYAGFILQAQIVSTRTVVGTFADAPINTKIMKCSREKDTMTHSSTMAKHSATYHWIAPDYDVHLVEFIATVAPSKETWWRNIKSSAMTHDPRPLTSPLPSFPPSIVPYTQDFNLAFPFPTKSPDFADDNINRYNRIDIKPSTPTNSPVPAKLPIINIPDSQNVPEDETQYIIVQTPQNIPQDAYIQSPKPFIPDFPEPPPIQVTHVPEIPDTVLPRTTTEIPAVYDSFEVKGPSYESYESGGHRAEEEAYAPTSPPEINLESVGRVTDTIINVTPNHKVNVDEITRDEGAEFPSKIHTNGPHRQQYHHNRRRPSYRRPRPPPEPWLGPGPDRHVFHHPWQRFSGWHGPRYHRWQSGTMQGYQSWRYSPTGRSAVDVPGVYEYRYYYKR